MLGEKEVEGRREREVEGRREREREKGGRVIGER